jgi:hypothetical protein
MATKTLRRSIPKEMFEVVDKARDEGWEASISGGHLRLMHPDYGKLTASTTPSNAQGAAMSLARDIGMRMFRDREDITRKVAGEIDDEEGLSPMACWACQQEGRERPKVVMSVSALAVHLRKEHDALLRGETEEEEPVARPVLEDVSIEAKVLDTMKELAGETLHLSDLVSLTQLDKVQIRNAVDRLVRKEDVPVIRPERGVYLYEPEEQMMQEGNGDIAIEDSPFTPTEEKRLHLEPEVAETTDKKPVRKAVRTPAPFAMSERSMTMTKVAETTTGGIVAKAEDGSVWLCNRI